MTDQDRPDRERGKSGDSVDVGLPIGLGLALGAGVGVALGNVAIGVAIGLVLSVGSGPRETSGARTWRPSARRGVQRCDGPGQRVVTGSSSASTRSNSVQAQVGQAQALNAPCFAASSADDQVCRLSRLPHFSHFLMSGMTDTPLRVQVSTLRVTDQR